MNPKWKPRGSGHNTIINSWKCKTPNCFNLINDQFNRTTKHYCDECRPRANPLLASIFC